MTGKRITTPSSRSSPLSRPLPTSEERRRARRFNGFAAAYAVSVYGNYLSLIALSLFSYAVTGSALGLGLLMALRLSAGMVAGGVAGGLAGRRDRRTMMVVSDLGQAAVMLVLAGTGEGAPVALVGAVVVVLGVGNASFNVALRTAVPVMAGHDQRVRANGLLVTARSFATVLGFASAAPIIAVGGYRVAFAVNALSFLVSAGALLVLRPRTNPEKPEVPGPGDPADPGAPARERRSAGGGGPKARTESGEGRRREARQLAVLRTLPVLLLAMVALRGADALGSSSHNVALPVAANLARPDSPAVLMAQFWAAWAIGSVLAHQLTTRLARRSEHLLGERAFALGTCVMSVSFIVAFTGLPTPALVCVAMVAGLADGFTDIAYTSRLQTLPDERRGRVFGLSVSAETTGFALGTLAAAAALEALPTLAVVGIFHGAALCGALTFLVFLAARSPGGDAQLVGHEPEMDAPDGRIVPDEAGPGRAAGAATPPPEPGTGPSGTTPGDAISRPPHTDPGGADAAPGGAGPAGRRR
ncbi:MFS transporter [Streptomyces sp. AJS327]|uniref:MFS transporter n=1 Tax=Streptomyces sp. AJS327 TaxID=2545265 RepID=UPI0015DF0541|nr:MFS transporter [Streptomyces sp. AJS327]MBA0053044.1 MFS transporter [Streptomyces sp. AJS327]